MRLSTVFLNITLATCAFLLSSGISCDTHMSQTIFVGCTPGDDLVKQLLAIPLTDKVDFIRWNLLLNESGKKTFTLDIAWGENQPNTLNFKNGGKKLSTKGEYTISPSASSAINGTLYHLTSSSLPAGISMIKINNNLLHLLTSQNQLMIGNGGWSYTLNNKELKSDTAFPTLTTLPQSVSTQRIYEGRTPCQDFAAEHNMNVKSSCFKLKWKLVLNMDSITHLPTTYSLRKIVDNAPRDVTGSWTIVKGTPSNPGAVLYKLDPQEAKNSILLWAADENILFFLHKDMSPFVGNDNFSFTLNRRQ